MANRDLSASSASRGGAPSSSTSGSDKTNRKTSGFLVSSVNKCKNGDGVPNTVKRTTQLLDRAATTSLIVRSASERRNALLQSGLIRAGKTQPSTLFVSSSPSAAMALSAKRAGAERYFGRSEKSHHQSGDDISLHIKAGDCCSTEDTGQTLTSQDQTSPTGQSQVLSRGRPPESETDHVSGRQKQTALLRQQTSTCRQQQVTSRERPTKPEADHAADIAQETFVSQKQRSTSRRPELSSREEDALPVADYVSNDEQHVFILQKQTSPSRQWEISLGEEQSLPHQVQRLSSPVTASISPSRDPIYVEGADGEARHVVTSTGKILLPSRENELPRKPEHDNAAGTASSRVRNKATCISSSAETLPICSGKDGTKRETHVEEPAYTSTSLTRADDKASHVITPTEEFPIPSRNNGGQRETDVAKAAYLAGCAAVPVQLLAPLEAVAGPPVSTFHPAYLDCRFCKEDVLQRTLSAVGMNCLAAAATPRRASCNGRFNTSFHKQLPVKVQGEHTSRHHSRMAFKGGGYIPEASNRSALATETGSEEVVAGNMGKEPLLQESTTFQAVSAVPDDATAITGNLVDTKACCSAEEGASCAHGSPRTLSMPPQNCGHEAEEARGYAVLDALSAALWRTVTRSEGRSVSHFDAKNRLPRQRRRLQQGQRDIQGQLDAVTPEEREEKRLEQRDACVLSGSLRAALAVRYAVALQESDWQIYDSCRSMTGSTEAHTAENANRDDTAPDPVASYPFCLPCAARRSLRNLPSLSSRSCAVGCFLVPRRQCHMSRLHAGKLKYPGAAPCTERREAEAQISSDTEACEPSSRNSKIYTPYSDHTPAAAEADLDTRDTHTETVNTGCWKRAFCRQWCRCGCRDESGGEISGCCSKGSSSSWTCHAAYLHLGMLYAAADIAASATAAAAGKNPRSAKTSAATAGGSLHIVNAETDRQPLGSVLLRRTLLSCLVAPMRAQLLLQRQQEQQFSRGDFAASFSASRRLLMNNFTEDESRIHRSETEAAIQEQQESGDSVSESLEQDAGTWALVDKGGIQVLPAYMRAKHPPAELGNGREENQEGADGFPNNTAPEWVFVCILDGLEQLRLCQWEQAAKVLNCVLSDVAKAAEMLPVRSVVAVDTQRQAVRVGTTGDTGPVNTCAEIPTFRTSAVNGSVAAKSPVGGEGSTVSKAGAADGALERSMTVDRVEFLLLWGRSRQAHMSAGETMSGAADTVSHQGLRERINRWQQRVRKTCPGARVRILVDEEAVDARAYSNMLQYLTSGRGSLVIKHRTADSARLPHLYDTVVGEPQKARSLRGQMHRQTEEVSEAQYMGKDACQCDKCRSICQPDGLQPGTKEQPSMKAVSQGVQNASRCGKCGSSCQRDGQQLPANQEQPSMKEVVQDVQQRGETEGHRELPSNCTGRALEDRHCVAGDRAKQSTCTLAVGARPCDTKMAEQAAIIRRQRRRDHVPGAGRSRERRREKPRKTTRPCMLFLCGSSFMAAPSLCEGRPLRALISGFPRKLQRFVHELEKVVYIPMVLRSRFGTASSRNAALSHNVTFETTSSRTAVTHKRALLQAQCERLLRWGDELVSPPRLLVHSCDFWRSRRPRLRSRSSRTLPQGEYLKRRENIIPPDGCVSPQHVLQLLGEMYSGDVQTFLLPVAALASSYVGETEEKLRHLLRQAAAAAPAVLVLLGLDHLAARRQLQKFSARYNRLGARSGHVRAPPQREQVTLSSAPASRARTHQHERCQELRPVDQSPGEQQDGSWPARSQSGVWSAAAGGDDGYIGSVGRVLGARRFGDRDGGKLEGRAGKVRQRVHIAGAVPSAGGGSHAGNADVLAAGCSHTASAREKTRRQHADASISLHSQSSGEDGDGDRKEGIPYDNRRGPSTTSSLRRRLLAALLVGLDDIEDRRSCCSALLKLEDPGSGTAAGERDEDGDAEAKLKRRLLQQQAGLAVVGVCSGSPEWLDEAVVRAGRLDTWLSWPQGPPGQT